MSAGRQAALTERDFSGSESAVADEAPGTHEPCVIQPHGLPDEGYIVPSLEGPSAARSVSARIEVTPDWKPQTEGGIGRAKAVGRSRARTHKTTWRELHARKGGRCRLAALGDCDSDTHYQLHHLLSKARGGPNEAWNLCALCPRHHGLITAEDPATKAALLAELTDEEYAGLTSFAGEGTVERLYA